MISRIRIEGFKSLRDVDLTWGPLNILIGPNASGKSNLLDALRLLQGIGYGFTVEEVLNGKPRGAATETWAPIRGGRERAAFTPRGGAVSPEAQRISLTVEAEGHEHTKFDYWISLSAYKATVVGERLKVNGIPIYDSEVVPGFDDHITLTVRYYRGTIRGRAPHLPFDRSRPILQQFASRSKVSKEHRDAALACAEILRDMQRLDPRPSVIAAYSQARIASRMGDNGENFATIVERICGDTELRAAYVSWLQHLAPGQIDDIAVMQGAMGEPLFAVKENGDVLPAPVLSDGTLRFAAIAAAFFQTDTPRLLTIEEIENGINPTRLRLLVELLRSQSKNGPQVVVTTHSPIVLAWLIETEYRTTFYCRRDEDTGESQIHPLADIPDFADLVSRQPISELFADGWLEGAL